MSGTVAKLAKPKMQGLLNDRIKKFVTLAFGVASANTFAYYFFIHRSRKLAYENFYKHYDADEDYKRMKKLGVFRSAPTDGPFRQADSEDIPDCPLKTDKALDEVQSLVSAYKRSIKNKA